MRASAASPCRIPRSSTRPRACAWALLFACAALGRPAAAGEAAHARPTTEEGDDAAQVSVVLVPQQRATLSAEVASTVHCVHADMGEAFDRDAPLITLDTAPYAIREAGARARLAKAEARLAQETRLAEHRVRVRRGEAALRAAQANLSAIETLHGQEQASDMELANARRDVVLAETDLEKTRLLAAGRLQDAKADVALAQADLRLARRERAACRVAAPWPGRVARVLVHEGERVEPGTPLVEVVNDRVLRAKCLLPSNRLPLVRKGQTLVVVLVETNERVDATISHVSPVLDATSRTFEVFARIDNPNGRLRAGMNGRLTLSDLGGE